METNVEKVSTQISYGKVLQTSVKVKRQKKHANEKRRQIKIRSTRPTQWAVMQYLH